MAVVRHKEAIHSGHFMVSEFEAEAQVGNLSNLRKSFFIMLLKSSTECISVLVFTLVNEVSWA